MAGIKVRKNIYSRIVASIRYVNVYLGWDSDSHHVHTDMNITFFVGFYFKFLSYWWIDLKDKRLWKFWKVSGNDLEIVLISVFYSFLLMEQPS